MYQRATDPRNHPYICVLKGIQEYILHMLYCRLISNSTQPQLSKKITVGARECILSPLKKLRELTDQVSRLPSREGFKHIYIGIIVILI